MKNILAILFLSVVFSCEKHDDTLIKNTFPGRYKILSITADKAVDLNMDGSKSTDIYNEIASPHHTENGVFPNFYDFNGPQNFMEVRPLPHHTNSAQIIYFNFPHQEIGYLGEDTFPFLRLYAKQFNFHKYELTKTNEVKIVEINPEYSIQFGKINTLHIEDNGILVLQLTKKIFDFVAEQWIDVELIVHYAKIE